MHSTVDIDDRNNCRPSSSKSENKHIILDTSEQDLSSSYRDTQDSDREDDSSTNGSASDQNLFISISESDSENSDIAIARPKIKKKKIDDESEDQCKRNTKKFVPVKRVEDIILSDSN